MKQERGESNVRFVTEGGANHPFRRLRGVLLVGSCEFRGKTLTFVFYVNRDGPFGGDMDMEGVWPATNGAVLRIGLFRASGGVHLRLILFAAVAAMVCGIEEFVHRSRPCRAGKILISH
jgi:hypothetical protein